MQYGKIKSIFWFTVAILLILLTGLRISLFKYGFCTAWDESYFLVKCQEAYVGDYVTGKSLWNYVAINWFPYLDLSSKVDACLASLILEIAAALIGTICCAILYSKKEVIKYFAINYLICFLWGSSFAGDVVNYVPLHSFLIYVATCATAVYFRYSKEWWSNLVLLITGISLGISVFIILPSTILLGLCLFLCVVFFQKERRYLQYNLLSVAIGASISLLYIHLFICDLNRVFEAMAFTANYITKVDYGYTPISFLIQIGLFFKDYIFTILFSIGTYFIVSKLSNKVKWGG